MEAMESFRADQTDRDFRRYRETRDPAALARAFDGLAPGLLLLAGHLTRDPAGAEDLVQTVFLQALRDAGSWDGKRPLVHWLAGILAHRAGDERRRSRLRAARPLPEGRGEETARAAEPLEMLADREAVERITGALDALAEPYREVLVLRVVHGLAPTEIAHALGRAPGTVRMQLQRARGKLREALPRELALPAHFLAEEGRGLAAVREAVLSAAPGAATGAAAGAAAGLTAKSWGWSGAGIALAGVAGIAGVLLWRSGDGREPTPALASVKQAAASGPGRAEPEIAEPASGPGERTALTPAAEETPPEEPAPEVAAGITAGITVVGTVTDLRGNPVPGAVVFGAGGESRSFHHELCRTDAAGAFTLEDAQPGLYLAARADGFQPSSFGVKRGAVQVRGEPGDTQTVRLRLGADGQRFSGAVVDALGRGAREAWLAIAVDEDARQQPEGMPVPREGAAKVDRESCWIRADESGRFATGEVPAGRALVVARPDDPASELVAWGLVDVAAGVDNGASFVLEPGAEVSGRVVDTSGRPGPGLRVESAWKGTVELGELEDELGPLLVDRRAETGADGGFRLVGLLPGEHELLVRGGGRTLASGRLELARGEARAWDAVVEAQSELAVRVLGPDGAALAGWGLGWKTGDSGRDFQIERDIRMPVALDAEGRYRIASMDLRPHTISVFPPPDAREAFSGLACAERPGVVPGPEELVVRLAPGEIPSASLTGTWVDARGAPLAHADLWLACRGDRAARAGNSYVAGARTDAQGRFRFELLPAGELALLADAPERYARGTLLAAAVLGPGEARELGPLALPDAARLSVELSAEDGGPITRPELELVSADRGSTSLRPDETGVFRSHRVAPGTYELEISGADLLRTRRTVEVAAPETVLAIACPRGCEVPFEFVLLHEGEPESPRYEGGGRIDLQVHDAGDEVVLSEREWKPFSDAGERLVRWSVRLPSGSFRALVVDHTWEREEGRSRPSAEVSFTVPEAGPLAPIRVELR